MKINPSRLGLVAALSLLSACSSVGTMGVGFSQDGLPDPIKVPGGNKVAWETVGSGDITYEFRDKAGVPGQTEWVFVGPKAVLKDRSGMQVGTYFGPPATWAALDGSKVTATQLAVAPAGAGNLPYQLVKANPATGQGAMTGVSYIQRVALKGGVARTGRSRSCAPPPAAGSPHAAPPGPAPSGPACRGESSRPARRWWRAA